jgi:L-amino acid N-acyltransferase YncA
MGKNMTAITFRPYGKADVVTLMEIWNDVLEDGVAFPGEERYREEDFNKLLESQSSVTCLMLAGEIVGFYILHPNNIGRCSHVANASYAISKKFRGRQFGKVLVEQSLKEAKHLGFRGMQFNAVVVGNKAAMHIYRQLGFEIIGTIKGGFRLKSGEYSDMHIMYKTLE